MTYTAIAHGNMRSLMACQLTKLPNCNAVGCFGCFGYTQVLVASQGSQGTSCPTLYLPHASLLRTVTQAAYKLLCGLLTCCFAPTCVCVQYGCNGSVRKELPHTDPWFDYTTINPDGKSVRSALY
jgi:hypothetical protein